MKTLILFVALFVSTLACAEDWNVILVTLDGVRIQEFFNSRLMPKMHGKLKDTFHTRRMKISNPYAISLPGYQSIYAGRSQGKSCRNNKLIDCPQIKDETFPERLVLKAGWAPTDAAAITSWDAMERALESNVGTIFLNHSQRPMIDPRDPGNIPPELVALNSAQVKDPAPWHPSRLDRYTFAYAKWYIKTMRPRYLTIGLLDSDEWGHEGKWKEYIQSVKRYDEWIDELNDFVMSLADYGEKTAIIVTTDHGRGRLFFWKTHDKIFLNAKKVWVAMKLPPKLTGMEMRSGRHFHHSDIRPTVESLLGQPILECDGCGQSLLAPQE